MQAKEGTLIQDSAEAVREKFVLVYDELTEKNQDKVKDYIASAKAAKQK